MKADMENSSANNLINGIIIDFATPDFSAKTNIHESSGYWIMFALSKFIEASIV
jgi:hypothetical protein